MIREWLPHLLVGMFGLAMAASGATYVAMSPAKQHQVEAKWSSWIPTGKQSCENTDNGTVCTKLVARLPPIAYMVWGSISFAVLGGFYVAAAMAGFVHRTEA